MDYEGGESPDEDLRQDGGYGHDGAGARPSRHASMHSSALAGKGNAAHQKYAAIMPAPAADQIDWRGARDVQLKREQERDQAQGMAPNPGGLEDRGFDALDPLDIAVGGFAGQPAALPHHAAIQKSFGHHDVSGVRAHVGGPAAAATTALGAEAYASGDQVAFRANPDLHTAAHETAHVVQQQHGVSLKGGVGEAGDAYEQEADRIAEAVVRGDRAEPLLDSIGGGSSGSARRGAIQRKSRAEGSRAADSGEASMSREDSRLVFSEPVLEFPPARAGIEEFCNAELSNCGDEAIELDSMTEIPEVADSPFSVYGLMAGELLEPGQVMNLTVGFQGRQAGKTQATLWVNGQGRPLACLPVSGTTLPEKTRRNSNASSLGNAAPVGPGSEDNDLTAETRAFLGLDRNLFPAAAGIPDEAMSTAPDVALQPPVIAFPATAVGDQSPVRAVAVTNLGNTPITIDSLARPDGSMPGYLRCDGAGSLEPGATASLSLVFSPHDLGEVEDDLHVFVDGVASLDAVAVSGVCDAVGATLFEEAPELVLAPQQVTFPNTLLGEQSPPVKVAVTNRSKAPVVVDRLVGRDGSPVSFVRCAGAGSVEPGARMWLELSFTPSQLGELAEPVQLLVDDGIAAGSIMVRGSSDGVAAVTLDQRDSEGLVPVTLSGDDYESWPIDNLARHHLQQIRTALTNYRGALEIFERVLESSSAGESQPRDPAVLYNPTTIVWKVLAKTLTAPIPYGGQLNEVIKEALGLNAALGAARHKEAERAGKATVSHTLGRFVVDRIGALTAAVATTTSSEELYLAAMRHAIEGKQTEDQKKLLKASVYYAAESLRDELSSSLSVESLFTQIAHEWVTETTVPGGRDGEASHLEIRLDDQWQLLGATLRAPRGDRLAEELLRQHGGSLNLRELAVPIKVFWYPEYHQATALSAGKWAFVAIRLQPDGSVIDSSLEVTTALCFGQGSKEKLQQRLLEQLADRGLPQIGQLDGNREF